MVFAVTNDFSNGTLADADEVNTNFGDVEDEFNNNTAPIGSIISWLKTFTNTPALPGGWVECNGQSLSDAESVYNGQTIPDLNGDNRFMRGNSTSGGTGGDEAMAHTHTVTANNSGAAEGSGGGDWNHTGLTVGSSAASNDENRPPFYDVVWIMRVK